MTSRTVPVDVSKLGERVGERRSPDRVGLPAGHGELPYDLPVRIEIERVMGDMPDQLQPGKTISGLLGWIFEMQLTICKATVWVKIYRDPLAFAIEVDGEEVHRWIQNPADAPVKFREILDELGRQGADFAERTELQPGDEVLEDPDNDGQVIINRAEEDEDAIVWE